MADAERTYNIVTSNRCIAVAFQKRAMNSAISFLLKLYHMTSSPPTYHSIYGFNQFSCHIHTFIKFTFTIASLSQFIHCRKNLDVY